MSIVQHLVNNYRETASILGWHRCREIWMLWGFFDESCEDLGPGRSGIKYLAVGGFVASSGQWEALSIEWAELLEREGARSFHMADLVAGRDQYEGWDAERREELLSRGLGIILRNVSYGFGVSVQIHDQFRRGGRKAGRKMLRECYQHSLEDILWDCGQHAISQKELIAMVFANHKDIDWNGVRAAFADFQAHQSQFHSLTLMSPLDSCPLQAADLMAYEASHAYRGRRDDDSEVFTRPTLKALMDARIVPCLMWKLAPPMVAS